MGICRMGRKVVMVFDRPAHHYSWPFADVGCTRVGAAERVIFQRSLYVAKFDVDSHDWHVAFGAP